MIELLKDLSLAFGPSGEEQEPREIFTDFLMNNTSLMHLIGRKAFTVDCMGNTIMQFGDTKGPKVMIAAHIDEVGYLISYINDEGFLFFKQMGGTDVHLIPGRAVVIRHGNKMVNGVIGRTAIHQIDKDDEEKTAKTKDHWIDIGAKNKKAAEKRVTVGDPMTFSPNFLQLTDKIVSGKALDDRAGVVAIAYIIKELYNKKLKYDVYCVATTQEEVGLKGSQVAAQTINPDIGIVLEVGFASDYPTGQKKEGEIKLGKGPSLCYGSTSDRSLTDKILEIARAKKIPYQLCAEPVGDGTDAWRIQLANSGARVINIDIPLRYMHTPYEILHLDDLKNAADLVCAFLRKK